MFFSLDIEPMAQSRPRITTTNGYTRAYEKSDIRKWKLTIAEYVLGDMVQNKWKMYDEETPLKCTILLTIPFPKSFSKKKKKELNGMPHNQKADIDNYVKAIFDALTNVVWKDDKQVAHLIAKKVWGYNANIKIQVNDNVECEACVRELGENEPYTPLEL